MTFNKSKVQVLALVSCLFLLLISCIPKTSSTSDSSSKSETPSAPDSNRYWHMVVGQGETKQDFWWDSQKEEIVRLNFGVDSSRELIGPQQVSGDGYEITQGNFKNTTVLEYTGKPPHIKYTFDTDASCKVEFMDQVINTIWSISEKSSKYE